MRVNTIFKYHFTFEYWTLQTDTNGATVFAKADDRVGMYVPSGGQGGYLVCAEAMDTPMQVRNLRDRAGKQLFAVGDVSFPMYVTSAEPQLDPFSNVIAYRHTLRRELPREYSQFIEEVLGAE